MTKKHFIALADVIKDHNRRLDTNQCDHFAPEHLAVLADFCRAHNPQFNRERWLGYIAGENGPCGGKVKPCIEQNSL